MKRPAAAPRLRNHSVFIFASHDVLLLLRVDFNVGAGDNKWSTVRTRLPECAPAKDSNMRRSSDAYAFDVSLCGARAKDDDGENGIGAGSQQNGYIIDFAVCKDVSTDGNG